MSILLSIFRRPKIVDVDWSPSDPLLSQDPDMPEPSPSPPIMKNTTTRLKDSPAEFRRVFKDMTWRLFMCWQITSLMNIMFGYDTTSFAGVQSIPAFAREFGDPMKDGSYALSASRVSFISSIGFAGKIVGALAASVPTEHLGHRRMLWATCIIAFAGVAIEATSYTVAQFVVGRIIIYFSVGVSEVVVPMYQAEIVPKSMRGAVVGSLQLYNQVGQITAAGVNRVFSTAQERKGWVIPITVQAIPPAIVLFSLLLVPDSPRWLLSRGRREDALKSLDYVRPRADVASGRSHAELDDIQMALENKIGKAPWVDVFRGANLRRTTLVLLILLLQQLTGQGFVSQYSPRFYTSVGLGAHAFDYNIASATAGWVGCLLGMIASDIYGRRDLLIFGALAQVLFLFLISGLGSIHNPSSATAGGLVASVVLFIFFFTGTWPPVSYAIMSEFPAAAVREKTVGMAIGINVIGAFVVSFSVPYLLDAISVNIGWLFGGIALFCAFFAYLCVPETKDRSLEEIDELFLAKIPARKFKSTHAIGTGRESSSIEPVERSLSHRK
ncbi:general substrate transporter [Xylariaceae sp. FL0255]|nr:general substrate transporter [Xylariaceae sp. FL0255]